jgi:hypothetical protein
MRYLTGLVLAVAMSGALFFGGGFGVARIIGLETTGGSLTSTHGLLGLGAVVGTGLLAGLLLAVPAISPLAAGLPGVALLGWSALLVLSAQRALRYIPLQDHFYAAGFKSMLVSGFLALLGAVLIVPLFVPSRWRGRGSADDEFTLPAVMDRLQQTS